jgi:hypothetical protein
MRAGKSLSGSGALQLALSLPPGTTILFSDEAEAWRAAKLVSMVPATVRSGGGLELTSRYPKAGGTGEVVETVLLPAGHLPLVVNEAELVAANDLATLTEPHEATLLHALDLRYREGRRCTRIGDLLVVLSTQSSPSVDGLCEVEDPEAWARVNDPAPHVFEVAARCARGRGLTHAVLVAGERGSGKSRIASQVNPR